MQFASPVEAALSLITEHAAKAKGPGGRYAQRRAAEVDAWEQYSRVGGKDGGDRARFWAVTAGSIADLFHGAELVPT